MRRTEEAIARARRAASEKGVATLAGRQLLVVSGKGGVGKSALSAALGRLLVAEGRRVLVLEVDPRENVHQMLGVQPSGGDIIEVSAGLYLQNLSAREVLDEAVRDQLKIGVLVNRVLSSPIYEHFIEGAPGLREIAVMGHAVRLVDQSWGRRTVQVDTVILDAPATGHGVSLLAAPGLASAVIRNGPFGRIAAELASLVTDPDRSGIVIATLAEEMPVQEAIEMLDMLRERLGRAPQLVIANGLYPAATDGEPSPVLRDAHALWRRRRQVNDEQLARLRAAWSGPLVELPLLPLERGPELTDALAERLRVGLGA